MRKPEHTGLILSFAVGVIEKMCKWKRSEEVSEVRVLTSNMLYNTKYLITEYIFANLFVYLRLIFSMSLLFLSPNVCSIM